jgi:MoxR-like ATPase
MERMSERGGANEVGFLMNQADVRKLLEAVRAELRKGIVGQDAFVKSLLLAVLANGHVLVESVPGLAKTRAVALLSSIADVSFKRIQFTPDLLPADIVGTRIFNERTANFETRKGPVFASFILADEINRAPAKVQSALLECMQERQVTIGDETIALPRPFLVFATQNPIEQAGTYQLPEAQMDRFLIKAELDYPSPAEESEVIEMVIQETVLPAVSKVLSGPQILALQGAVRAVHIERKLIDYIAAIVQMTRDLKTALPEMANYVAYGASPRASIAMAQVARAEALMAGRDHVIPEDVKAAAMPVLRHRVILTYHAEAEEVKSEAIVEKILSRVKVP